MRTRLQSKKRRLRQRCIGEFITDAPIALWIFFVLILFPLISMLTLSYRCFLVFYATYASAMQAGKASTYALAATTAQQVATAALVNNPGITPIPPNITTAIVVQPISGGAEVSTVGPLPADSVDIANNIYFVQCTIRETVKPLLPVPGLPTEFPITFTHTVYSENPNGLAAASSTVPAP